MENVSMIIATGLLFLVLEGAVLVILFSFKNKLATKITKFLMKTQGISWAKTMQDVDDQFDEIIREEEKRINKEKKRWSLRRKNK